MNTPPTPQTKIEASKAKFLEAMAEVHPSPLPQPDADGVISFPTVCLLDLACRGKEAFVAGMHQVHHYLQLLKSLEGKLVESISFDFNPNPETNPDGLLLFLRVKTSAPPKTDEHPPS